MGLLRFQTSRLRFDPPSSGWLPVSDHLFSHSDASLSDILSDVYSTVTCTVLAARTPRNRSASSRTSSAPESFSLTESCETTGITVSRRRSHLPNQRNSYANRTFNVVANCVAWARTGDADHDGCVVVICNGNDDGTKKVEVGKEHAGEKWTDVLGWHQGEITIDESTSKRYRLLDIRVMTHLELM